MRSVSKALRFPFAGLAEDATYRESTYPSEEGAYNTPDAVNVIGECAFSGRLRGGSRPGLKRVEVSVPTSGRWLWPNGEPIAWPSDGGESPFVAFAVTDSATMPDGSSMLVQHPVSAVYRNRLVKCEGSVWMASRTGDFADFDFGADGEDVTRAVAGNLAFAGRKGEPITAMCAFGDSRLFVATRRGLAVISGEPTSGMTIVSEHVGIIGPDAWCNANGTLFFMGLEGLYAVGEGGATKVSGKLPRALSGLSHAILAYDPNRNGIHVFTNRTDYFYDLSAQAFWPVAYPLRMRPVAAGTAFVDGENRLVFHCADGAWRYWDDDSDTDDGEQIASGVVIGPFKCGIGDRGDGMLESLNATLAEGSADVSFFVFAANSAEAVVKEINRVSAASGLFHGGLNKIVRTRTRGAWAKIVLECTGKWAYEVIQANIKNLGGLR